MSDIISNPSPAEVHNKEISAKEIPAPKALIAMSGGVDSSVAAKLTQEAGYECIGCTMKLYNNDLVVAENEAKTKTCCALSDVEDARSVAYRLGMPFYVFNFEEDFDREVISRFIASYEAGITPNPCIECNRYMKFEKLLGRAKELGCDILVTGHYARVEEKDGRYHLYKATDPGKDQSYVLYSLTQEQLAHVRFPLGAMDKSDTRAIAESSGFINAHKPDSQDICFVPDGDYASVIRKRTGKDAVPGDFVDLDGKVMGTHKGIIHYTIGQRRGLGLSVPESVYVCKICPENNTVILGHNEDLFTTTVQVKDFNWTSGIVPSEAFDCEAKIRYRQPARPARVIPTGSDTVRIEFAEPQRAITPGQAAVLYDGDEVLGGGVIIGS